LPPKKPPNQLAMMFYAGPAVQIHPARSKRSDGSNSDRAIQADINATLELWRDRIESGMMHGVLVVYTDNVVDTISSNSVDELKKGVDDMYKKYETFQGSPSQTR
jgi:hypothetical protein